MTDASPPQRRRQADLSHVFTAMAGILTVMAVSLAGLGLLGQSRSASELPITSRLDQLEEEIVKVRRQQAALAGRIDRLSDPAPGASAAQLQDVQAQQVALAAQLKELEAALRPDTAKSLQVPLLARDVSSLREGVQESDDNLRREIDSVRTIMLGTVGVLALGILAQSLASFARARSATAEKNTTESP